MSKERIGSFILLLAGIYAFFSSLQLSMGKLTQPGPGMFPLILSVLLCTVTDGLLDYSLPLSIWTLPLGLSFQMVGFGDPLCDLSTSNLVFFRENSYSPSTHGTLGGMITF